MDINILQQQNTKLTENWLACVIVFWVWVKFWACDVAAGVVPWFVLWINDAGPGGPGGPGAASCSGLKNEDGLVEKVI